MSLVTLMILNSPRKQKDIIKKIVVAKQFSSKPKIKSHQIVHLKSYQFYCAVSLYPDCNLNVP